MDLDNWTSESLRKLLSSDQGGSIRVNPPPDISIHVHMINLLWLFASLLTIGIASSTSITIALPPTSSAILGKCGLREYFFLNQQCPWNHPPRTKQISVLGVVKIGTVPEACWYNAKTYSLSYYKNGNKQNKREPLPERFTRHPQCHISMDMIVVKQKNDRSASHPDFNDPASSGFQVVQDSAVAADSELTHHMDNKEFLKRVQATKQDKDYIFVKPFGWQEIAEPDGSVIVRPNPDDFKHLPSDLNDISKFQELSNGWSSGAKDYGSLKFGPIVGMDGLVVYDDTGLPKYRDSFQEKDYKDLRVDEKPTYNRVQYPTQEPGGGGKKRLVEDQTPAYCHQSSAYSENTKFIKFLRPGRYLIGYNNLKVDHCLMGVQYDVEGMKKMVSDDRYLIVEVGVAFHSASSGVETNTRVTKTNLLAPAPAPAPAPANNGQKRGASSNFKSLKSNNV